MPLPLAIIPPILHQQRARTITGRGAGSEGLLALAAMGKLAPRVSGQHATPRHDLLGPDDGGHGSVLNPVTQSPLANHGQSHTSPWPERPQVPGSPLRCCKQKKTDAPVGVDVTTISTAATGLCTGVSQWRMTKGRPASRGMGK